jgi:hypoxanthine-guanine phosphoribosyltransferase
MGMMGLSPESRRQAVQRIAAAITADYRNGFTLLGILEGGRVFAEEVSNELDLLRCQHMTAFLGIRKVPQADGSARTMVFSPPSVHLLHNKKVVILDDLVDTGKTAKFVGIFVNQKWQRPSRIEYGALVVVGDLPKWVRPEYVGHVQAKETSSIKDESVVYNGEAHDGVTENATTNEENVT